MKKIMLMLLSIAFIGVLTVQAQSRYVTGTVTSSEDDNPIPGVSIVIKGTTVGTVTNIDGVYRIKVPKKSDKLVFSFIGMNKVETAVTSNTMNIVLKPNNIGLNEVVVTALGITRSEKTLGYAATTVSSDELAQSHNTNVVNSLSGKVAGLQVQATSSDPGAASSVTIRGFGSINGSNQPLYVIDGSPLQNTTINTSGHSISVGGISGVASTDIKSMTILKGAAATALYGSRAANGVILITTKNGSRGKDRNYTIQYNGSMKFRQVSLLPTFQNDFGQGWNGAQTYIENGSWGPAFDGSTQVYGPIWNHSQLIHEYSAKKDNVKDFFDIGLSSTHSLSISGVSSDDKMTYYLSVGTSKDDGIMPTDADLYKRKNFAFRSTYEPEKWIKISSSVNFSKTETDVVGSDQGTTVIDGLYEMPRDVSIVDMKDLSSAFNTPEAYYTPYGITNPYWALENNYNHTNAKQIYGKLQLDIMPLDNFTVTYRLGYDYTDYDRKVGFPEIDLDDALIDEAYGTYPSSMNQDGYVYTSYRRAYEINHDFLINYDNKIGDYSLNINVGGNINERYSTIMKGETNGLTFDTGYWDLSNGSSKSLLEEEQSKRRLMGLIANATLGYKDILFLEGSAREDWSSTLPLSDNNFFYSGITLSYLFTEMLPKNDFLTFGKVRLAYGKTGNDASPYYTTTSYDQAYADGYYGYDIEKFPMNSTNSFIASTTAGSTSLKPEMTYETEVGLSLQFLQNRIGLDASYYKRKTDDQIFTLPVDPATGYTKMVQNFGEVQNKGIELILNTTPVRSDKFRWDLNFNFSRNRNKVVSMPESLDGGKVTIGSYSAGDDAVYMYAEKGKAIGEYYTYLPQYVTDKNSEFYGMQIVDEYGQPVLGSDVEDTGKNMNHKWLGGITTNFSAYGFTLSAALDIRYGGYMFSRTKNLMEFTGNGIITTYNDRNPFVIPNSVVASGDSYVENTTEIKISDGSYQDYFDLYGWGHGGESLLLDRSYAKLRNITLSYNLPQKWINKIYMSDVSVSAFVDNAFTWVADDNYYVDPESTTEGSDLDGTFGELYSNPSCRIFGFSLNIKY